MAELGGLPKESGPQKSGLKAKVLISERKRNLLSEYGGIGAQPKEWLESECVLCSQSLVWASKYFRLISPSLEKSENLDRRGIGSAVCFRGT